MNLRNSQGSKKSVLLVTSSLFKLARYPPPPLPYTRSFTESSKPQAHGSKTNPPRGLSCERTVNHLHLQFEARPLVRHPSRDVGTLFSLHVEQKPSGISLVKLASITFIIIDAMLPEYRKCRPPRRTLNSRASKPHTLTPKSKPF